MQNDLITRYDRTMDDIKKGQKIKLADPDGLGATDARVVSVDEDCVWITVKWLAPVWDIRENILVHRKGTTSVIHVDRLRLGAQIHSTRSPCNPDSSSMSLRRAKNCSRTRSV